MSASAGTGTKARPRGAHLVGSIPLTSADEVFAAVAGTLGKHVRRIPDGETGARRNFIEFQAGVFAGDPAFIRLEDDPSAGASLPQFKLDPEADPDTTTLADLGYAEAAARSYEAFARLKRESLIDEEVRFLVTMPSTRTVMRGFIEEGSRDAVEEIYERALAAELERLLAAIPHEELAFQTDTVFEVGVWDGAFESASGREGALERILAVARLIPAEVEVGFHLCYGDSGHKHFVQPRDTQVLVELSQAILANVGRPVNWLHLPVPRDRDDEAYFTPLEGLELGERTELYLGLVHHTDGAEGTARRIEAASRVRQDFGVATECGFGRRPVEQVDTLLRIHAEVADPVR